MSINLAPALPDVTLASRFGLVLMLLFFGGFGAWAAFAPLSSAAIAPAMVVVEGNRRIIQHLEGGIVAEMPVRNGDQVEVGTPLLVLDRTMTAATVARLRTRLDDTRARVVRLQAEQDGLDTLNFADAFGDQVIEPGALQAIDSQQRTFDARRQTLETEIDVLTQRKGQLSAEISGLRKQIAAQNVQLDLIQQELRDVQTLLEAGLERRPRYLALQRKAAEIDESRAGRTAAIARAQQSIGEADLRILELRQARASEATEQLALAQAELADLRERMAAATDVLERTVIRAPTAGIVVGTRVFTVGAVIAPGAPILEIVPQNDRLIIEARLRPTDIDSVREGLDAEVRITAFNQRDTPTLSGTVINVSADLLQDERTGEGYYSVRIMLSNDEAQTTDLVLYPGMPAEAAIITGSTTALDYLLTPILRTVDRGLREE